MCGNTCSTSEKRIREFRTPSGRVVHCSACQSFGIEIGTAYLIVDHRELTGFVNWYRTVRQSADEQGDDERLYLQIEQSRVMLALSKNELDDLGRLLEQSLRWRDAFPVPLPVIEPASAWVH